MQDSQSPHLEPPYLIFIGDVDTQIYAKTGLGMVQWCPQHVAGQLRFEGNGLDLGVPELSLEEAVAAGIKSLIIGVAPVGGVVNARWIQVLTDAAKAGLNIVSGLHILLEHYAELVAASENSGAKLINVRVPPKEIPVGTGIKRTGKRVLMVGTDCAVGKKYTALALSKSLRKMGVSADFCATGQTGIMIAGKGIPIDAVVSDFVSGAAEIISPDNQPDHWDIIEGQGSLFNPSFAGVSLGLLHGSQPDAIIVCHDATRKMIESCPHLPVPDIRQCIELNIQCGKITNPTIQCIGISVNTSGLPQSQRDAYKQQITSETGLICIDSVIDGCDAIAAHLIEHNHQAVWPAEATDA